MQPSGIDLTTFAAGAQPPADLSHPIYDYPSHADFPRMDLSLPEVCAELHTLKGRVSWMERQLAKRKARWPKRWLQRLKTPMKTLAKLLLPLSRMPPTE